MRDRQPTRPRRVLITPENGNSPFYGTIDMADEPYEGFEGTEWNKLNVLPDTVAETIGLDPESNPTPADAFALLANVITLISNTLPNLVPLEVPADNGYSGTLRIYNIGGICFLFGSVTVTSTLTVALRDIAQLTAGYLPKDDSHRAIISTGSSNAGIVFTNYGNYVRGSGAIQLYNPISFAEGTTFFLNAIWIADH